MDAATLPTTTAPEGTACRSCGGPTIGWGKDSHGNPRRFCKACKKSYGIIPPRPLGPMRISIRLLLRVGAKCEDLLGRMITHVPAVDVQCDELWSVVRMKEKTKVRKGITDPEIGDAYTFLALQKTSKLILAHHVGRRTSEDANLFAAKLSSAVNGDRFQVSTDGFDGYPAALEQHFGGQIDYAMLIKSFSGEGLDSERRYSPPSIIGTEKRVISGSPEESLVCTSHVERLNLHVRMMSRRFTRLTTGFSKKRDNLKAAVSLFAASYNLCWRHSALRMSPAMYAGLTRKVWTVGDLLTA